MSFWPEGKFKTRIRVRANSFILLRPQSRPQSVTFVRYVYYEVKATESIGICHLVWARLPCRLSDAHLTAAASAPCGSPSCPSAAASRSPRWSSGSLCLPLICNIQPSFKLDARPPMKPLLTTLKPCRDVSRFFSSFPLSNVTNSEGKRRRASLKLRPSPPLPLIVKPDKEKLY